MTNENTSEDTAETSATTSVNYPQVFSYNDIKEDNGEEMSGAMADAMEGLDEKSLFSLVNDMESLQEGWSVFIDRRDAGTYEDKPRVFVYQLPDLDKMMESEKGREFVADSLLASFSRKIGAMARGALKSSPVFALPQDIGGLITGARSGVSSGKKRMATRAFRAVAPDVIKSLNAAYRNKGVSISFDMNALKACLADANLAEAQHPSLPNELWEKIIAVLESKITDYVKNEYKPKPDSKDPETLDLEKELAQLEAWKATRNDQAEAGDVIIEDIDFD